MHILAQSGVRTFYENVPLLPLTQWWHGLLIAFFGILLLIYIVWMYRRDSADLPVGLTILLTTLRVAAFAGLFLFFVNPEKRSETEILKNSRAAVLIDTSLSMGLTDPGDGSVPLDQLPRRIDSVIDSLRQTDLIKRLSKNHEVTVYRFGESSQPEAVTTFAKSNKTDNVSLAQRESENRRNSIDRSRSIAVYALICLVASALILVGVFFCIGHEDRRELKGWLLAASMLMLVVGMGLVAAADLTSNHVDLWTSLGFSDAEEASDDLDDQSDNSNAIQPMDPQQFDWRKSLTPSATATRMGDSLQQIVNRERGGPIAAIVLVTDGRSNSGQDPQRALASAVDAGIPLYTIGIGSDQEVQNVQVTEVQAPPRAFPEDKFKIKGIIQASGLTGQTVNVKLVSIDTKGKEAELEEADTSVRLLDSGEPVSVEFEVARQEEGKRKYIIRVDAPPRDLDDRDNERSAVVEIVTRKSKILLMAGGPTRDYRFLRNQLFRDENVELHVLLQSSRRGADQESDKLLEMFPATREDMYQYDCLIGFDPDWKALSPEQADLLERWVAEQAGGLILIAGAVQTPEWTRAERGNEVIDKIRRLYPVSFYSQGTARLKLGRFGGDEEFPLKFTRDGRAAEFLWLGETASESQSNWEEWDGVAGYYAVNEAKRAASILAYFSDDSTAINDQLPIYLCSQYYGAGRVFFQASGEMWRIRELDVDYFQDYYNKLVRWASQGRLLRDSTRGVLLTDRDRCWVGDQINVQAILRDDQDQPLALKEVESTVLLPNGQTQQLKLLSSDQAVRPGTFVGSFLTPDEGDYRISLLIPGSAELETLTKTVQANIPDLEKEQPQRNDALLTELAEKTDGYYFVGMGEATAPEGDWMKLEAMIQPMDQKSYLPGTPDRDFTRLLMQWLLVMITLVLAIEWTCRRLHKLA